MKDACLGKMAVEAGGLLRPLIVPAHLTGGQGLMNPSVYMDGDRLLVAIRQLNYTLYHAEKLKFCNTWGPLAYLNPENDQHLRTSISIAELDKETLAPISILPVIMLPIAPADAMFIGLEDARLFRWEGKLYLCGVRRDVDSQGTGRMELSEIEQKEDGYYEVDRKRIPIPGPGESFCEKNWMPILDESYRFVKWLRPTEVVEYDPVTDTTKTVILGPQPELVKTNLRGGSQVIPFGYLYGSLLLPPLGQGKLAVVHETNLHPTPVGHKNATYRHRFVLLDKNYTVIKQSELFSFMDAEIEFCCGATWMDGKLLLSFGFQDNAAYILSVPRNIVTEMLGEPAAGAVG
jgi:hypothetical protein